MVNSLNQTELLEKVTEVLVDHFELERSLIKPEARLQEDLDLDSIDGIELIIKLEEQYSNKIPEEWMNIHYPAFQLRMELYSHKPGMVFDFYHFNQV